ncbi:MAG: uroporphyrinogen decarboxylase family protein [Spirochaetia bacterium]
MTNRQRLLTVLNGGIPDSVPVSPDFSNMIPCKMTGKPFWDIYLHKDPPLWKAYLDAMRFFGNDAGFELYDYGPVDVVDGTSSGTEERIVHRDAERILTQAFDPRTGEWSRLGILYSSANPPVERVDPDRFGVPQPPREWENVNTKPQAKGYDLWCVIKKEVGESGILGMSSGFGTVVLGSERDVYSWYDDPKPWIEKIERMTFDALKRIDAIARLPVKPDFLTCGGSGTLIFQTPDFVRDHVLPGLKKVTRRAKELGIPTHVHSCGPERKLIDMVVDETDLTVIDPLEVPPMGDCNLSEIKKKYGDRIVLKGNLHTTEVMLLGSVEDVIRKSREAIDAAKPGGRFILSTGDQCGRETPFENIRAMIETARTYGRY